ncbi:hypothetical protein A2926_04165 [Candidatus Giovannonibacteria bacterium RIFCSPLOWO2_01_FULL_44_40]|uniref:Uncharacterized protein n=1 Tax=Candidatus Giovannonibacteria bacterium RIFCSPHIGHO2_01_FULL_45_23 TaxID=1798325 RepID=A0A1F5VHF3_9BACT|nr:MAG: hypothetical protein A2834_00035 [Candidatus Giovannonibacteria bacterium RIFCSPHIGHO2_01_FULL_45_23]OGF75328.1 MAG: hypothetical protein A3C77_01400 [Candidatus Giovannonibacteria bacterium RIFCSPHIGHO2_02_FULL_45_13]OGF79885.1 MAG: hypothetical protein A2926_04165 [Candidatus Giovannonibacteria bacterium RIFCSPLOWO2_01_FULL_44_40]
MKIFGFEVSEVSWLVWLVGLIFVCYFIWWFFSPVADCLVCKKKLFVLDFAPKSFDKAFRYCWRCYLESKSK